MRTALLISLLCTLTLVAFIYRMRQAEELAQSRIVYIVYEGTESIVAGRPVGRVEQWPKNVRWYPFKGKGYYLPVAVTRDEMGRDVSIESLTREED